MLLCLFASKERFATALLPFGLKTSPYRYHHPDLSFVVLTVLIALGGRARGTALPDLSKSTVNSFYPLFCAHGIAWGSTYHHTATAERRRSGLPRQPRGPPGPAHKNARNPCGTAQRPTWPTWPT